MRTTTKGSAAKPPMRRTHRKGWSAKQPGPIIKLSQTIPEIDEVERCRQVRRSLERSHGNLKGLCDWLEAVENGRQKHKNRRQGHRKVT